MILIAVSCPLGLLCLYLGYLGWNKNRKASAVLLVFALVSLGFSAAVTLFLWLFSQGLGWP